MTDERSKSSPGGSVARPTARDVPFVRSDLQSEPAPQGQRPGQLPRDPSYEQELAAVDLAVLRDPGPRQDPSTKQGGGRGHALVTGQPPESITPESPGARARQPVVSGQSPEPPSSVGRAVASGTLLSVGAVDPRGKTERTLETPRMFFSQQSAADEAYFKPGKIPAVTVHQTLETETVKLSDSIDPRRAKTIPRLDRVVLPQPEDVPSAAPMMLAGPGSAADSAMPRGERWTDSELAADPASLPSNYDRQIHASLSAFRDQGEPSYSLDGAPTRQEPLGRRAAEVEPSLPEPSAVPTHRDLPAHRIEASQPPPAPVGAVSSRGGKRPDVGEPESEGPRPTTASIAAEEPVRRPVWINYAAFAAALLLALVVGFYLTREPDPGREVEKTRAVPPTPALPALPLAPAEAKHEPPKVATPAVEAEVASSPPPALATPAAPPAAAKKAPSPPAAAPPPAAEAPPKPAPKSQRETIF